MIAITLFYTARREGNIERYLETGQINQVGRLIMGMKDECGGRGRGALASHAVDYYGQ